MNLTKSPEQIRISDVERCQEDLGYDVHNKTWETMNVSERRLVSGEHALTSLVDA